MVLDQVISENRFIFTKIFYSFHQKNGQAYKKLSLVYHPDKTAGMGAEQKEEPLGSEQIGGYG